MLEGQHRGVMFGGVGQQFSSAFGQLDFIEDVVGATCSAVNDHQHVLRLGGPRVAQHLPVAVPSSQLPAGFPVERRIALAVKIEQQFADLIHAQRLEDVAKDFPPRGRAWSRRAPRPAKTRQSLRLRESPLPNRQAVAFHQSHLTGRAPFRAAPTPAKFRKAREGGLRHRLRPKLGVHAKQLADLVVGERHYAPSSADSGKGVTRLSRASEMSSIESNSDSLSRLPSPTSHALAKLPPLVRYVASIATSCPFRTAARISALRRESYFHSTGARTFSA